MSEYFARTGNRKKDICPETYLQHITQVVLRSEDNARKMLACGAWDSSKQEDFLQAVTCAATVHDLGKLDDENQGVLRGYNSSQSLPVKHDDAACALLIRKSFESNEKVFVPLLLCFAHHGGLPDIPAQGEGTRGDYQFRKYERKNSPDRKVHVDSHLDVYRQIHEKILGKIPEISHDFRLSGLALRLALSCLVDADFGDAARHSKDEMDLQTLEPRWEERLAALERYQKSLRVQSERSRLRTEIFEACRDANCPDDRLVTCVGPVGTGKTTAVMAYLLKMAIKHGLRHIFVVVPYTNIIQQSVNVYRKALVLPGEDPERIVAEHHHLADFQSLETLQNTTLWNAPIIVTTAVQFFETLGSCRPTPLRKFHEVPGSAIFVDEAHAAMPLKLWPQEWRWMRELTEKWGCHFALGSGSLIKFWEEPAFIQPTDTLPAPLPDLLPPPLLKKAQTLDSQRCHFETECLALDLPGIVKLVRSDTGGAKLVVVNTVQSAAVIANEFRKQGVTVRHLSTALTPRDRSRILAEIHNMLDPKSTSYTADWVLVATSCVEAGVDFSFQKAYREACSVTSLVQISGRINRNFESSVAGRVVSFRLQDGGNLSLHPGFRTSAQILDTLFREGWFDGKRTTDEIVQESFRRELGATRNSSDSLIKAEDRRCYEEVAALCRVIDSDTRLVVVSEEIVARLENGERVSSVELQQNSVQLWGKKIAVLALPLISGHEDLYKLGEKYEYDSTFLGWMTEKNRESISTGATFF